MRKFALIITISFLSLLSLAQPSKVLSASMDYQDGKLLKAQSTIEKAILDERSKKDDKTWKVRGQIYAGLISASDVDIDLERIVLYERLLESYTNLKSIRAEGPFYKEAKINSGQYGNMALSEGVGFFNKKEYKAAVDMFGAAVDLAAFTDRIDTLAIYNIGLASERMNDYSSAIRQYEKCVELNYRAEDMYSFIVFGYAQMGNTEGRQKAITDALKKFPENANMRINALNNCLSEGDLLNAFVHAEKLTQIDPSSDQYHFVLGTIYDNMGKLDEAVLSYKDALEANPDFFDANYNLGALYFNMGVEIGNAAIDEEDKLKYEKMKKEADLEFNRALIYLERARELNTTDRNTLSSLLQLYARLGETEKYEEVKAALEN